MEPVCVLKNVYQLYSHTTSCQYKAFIFLILFGRYASYISNHLSLLLHADKLALSSRKPIQRKNPSLKTAGGPVSRQNIEVEFLHVSSRMNSVFSSSTFCLLSKLNPLKRPLKTLLFVGANLQQLTIESTIKFVFADVVN